MSKESEVEAWYRNKSTDQTGIRCSMFVVIWSHLRFKCIAVHNVCLLQYSIISNIITTYEGYLLFRFDVNFQRGDHPDADILFHFNPRFKEELEKIIFNSRGPDGWGFQGEKYEKIASRGSPFKLVFMVWSNSFQVSS